MTPKCESCRKLSFLRQCDAIWPDATETGVVRRKIWIEPATAPGDLPAEHVFRFWCQGDGYQDRNSPKKARK